MLTPACCAKVSEAYGWSSSCELYVVSAIIGGECHSSIVSADGDCSGASVNEIESEQVSYTWEFDSD